MSIVIAVDGGTGSLRADVYDATGCCLGTASRGYHTQLSPGGRAEQDSEDWWNATAVAMREAVARAVIAPDAVQFLTVDTTCWSMVPLDGNARAIRPSIIWMDIRAGQEAAVTQPGASSGCRSTPIRPACCCPTRPMPRSWARPPWRKSVSAPSRASTTSARP